MRQKYKPIIASLFSFCYQTAVKTLTWSIKTVEEIIAIEDEQFSPIQTLTIVGNVLSWGINTANNILFSTENVSRPFPQSLDDAQVDPEFLKLNYDDFIEDCKEILQHQPTEEEIIYLKEQFIEIREEIFSGSTLIPIDAFILIKKNATKCL